MPRPLPKPQRWPATSSSRLCPHSPAPRMHGGALSHRSLATCAVGSHLGLLAQLPSSQPKRRIPALTGDGTPASGSARLFPDPLGCFRIGSAGAPGVGGAVWSREAERIRVDAECGSRLSCSRVGPPPRSRAPALPRSLAPWKLGALPVFRSPLLVPQSLLRPHSRPPPGTPGLSPGGRSAQPPPSLRPAALPP